MSISFSMNMHDIFDYEPTTGVIVWKRRDRSQFMTNRAYGSWNALHSGKVAGTKTTRRGTQGYVSLHIAGRRFYAHRIIWEMHYGPVPDGKQVDHIDSNTWNNRIENLRAVTAQQNIQKMRVHRDTASKLKGVRRYKNSPNWNARITHQGKEVNLGTFPTKGLAALHRAKALLKIHGNGGHAY